MVISSNSWNKLSFFKVNWSVSINWTKTKIRPVRSALAYLACLFVWSLLNYFSKGLPIECSYRPAWGFLGSSGLLKIALLLLLLNAAYFVGLTNEEHIITHTERSHERTHFAIIFTLLSALSHTYGVSLLSVSAWRIRIKVYIIHNELYVWNLYVMLWNCRCRKDVKECKQVSSVQVGRILNNPSYTL